MIVVPKKVNAITVQIPKSSDYIFKNLHSREVFILKAPRLFLCQNRGETFAIYPAGGGGEGTRDGSADLSADL